MNNDFLPRRGIKNKYPSQQSWERPVAFRSPEFVAHQEEQNPPTTTAGTIISHHPLPKKSLKEKLQSLTKKQWIIIGVVATILLAGIGFGVYYLWFRDEPVQVKQPVTKKAEETPPAPAPIVSTLTGLPVADASVNDRPVTAIMIENSRDARPQSGLNQAGVVFEAIAEGGITRFLALWQDTEPEHIGPVRSVRPYYVQWALGFDAAIAHAGGSKDALNKMKEWNVKDLDQFHNSAPYWRVSNRYAPHNLYTSLPKLRELEAKKGYGKANYTGFSRKTEAPSTQPTAKSIDFTISGAIYNAHYDYDASTNSYKRSEGGKPHTDERSGQQLAPKVVIGLVMEQSRNDIYTAYATIGSGTAFVFQDGIVKQGTWHKDSNGAQFTFKDENGVEIKLNPGQTWLTVVGATSRVAHKP